MACCGSALPDRPLPQQHTDLKLANAMTRFGSHMPPPHSEVHESPGSTPMFSQLYLQPQWPMWSPCNASHFPGFPPAPMASGEPWSRMGVEATRWQPWQAPGTAKPWWFPECSDHTEPRQRVMQQYDQPEKLMPSHRAEDFKSDPAASNCNSNTCFDEIADSQIETQILNSLLASSGLISGPPPQTLQCSEAEALRREISSAVAEFLAGNSMTCDNDAGIDQCLGHTDEEDSSTLTTFESHDEVAGVSETCGPGSYGLSRDGVKEEGCRLRPDSHVDFLDPCPEEMRALWKALALTPGQLKALWTLLLTHCRSSELGLQLAAIELTRKLIGCCSTESEVGQPSFEPCIGSGEARLLLQVNIGKLLPPHSSEPETQPLRIRIKDHSDCVCSLDPAIRLEWKRKPICQCANSLWLSNLRVRQRPVYQGVSFNSSFVVCRDELGYDGQGSWVYCFSGRPRARIASDAMDVRALLGRRMWTSLSTANIGSPCAFTLVELNTQRW